jgi:DNA (cytosine-5)-methyltransferase 1
MKKTIRMADLFCGAGGTSEGAVQAGEEKGFTVDLTAVNHAEDAIHTHVVNHPGARHLLTSLDNINPRELYQPGELDILWASPECTHHSTARGGRPIQEQSRATAMCVIRWAEALLPPVVLVENVAEFLTWGPIDHKGRPIPHRKGEIFAAWRAMLVAIGYTVDHRILCAADHGDPTTRKRLFVQAVRGPRRRIRWPEPSHYQMKEHPEAAAELFLQRRKPWRSARDHVIDWGLKGQLLTDRKKPLADKTHRRILVGFFKQLEKKGFGPFVVPNFGERKGQTPRSHDVDEPAPAVTSHGAGGLVEPEAFIIGAGGPTGSAKPVPVSAPLGTVLAADRRGIVEPELEPMIIPQNGSNNARPCSGPAPTLTTTSRGVGLAEPLLVRFQGDHAGRDDGAQRTQATDQPLGTVTTENRYGLAEPMIVGLRGGDQKHINAAAKTTEQPLSAVTCKGTHHALVEPMVVQMKGTHAAAIDSTATTTERPLGTLTAQNAFGLAEPVILGIDHQSGDHTRSAEEPLSTATTKARHAIAEPHLVQVNHGNGKCGNNGDGRRCKSIEEPLPTVCGERGEWAIVEPSLLPQQSGGAMRPVSEPVPTVATDGAIGFVETVIERHPAIPAAGPHVVKAYLVKFYGTGTWQSIDEPLDSVTTKDRFGLVLPVLEIDGEKFLVNFRFRMLQPHELAAAQGFPKGYVFKGTKTQQVKQIGNAVPCNLAKALVKAVLQ